MDALSQLLHSLRLRASFLAAWNLGAPWGMAFAPTGAARFHHVESGSMWLITNRRRRILVERGDLVVVFDGGGHRLGDRPETPARPIEELAAIAAASGVHRHGGLGPKTQIVCGNFIVDERDSLAGSLQRLPALVHLRAGTAPLRAITQTLDLLAQELRGEEPGAEHAAALLTETLFVHVIRAVLADGEPGLASWLEGLRDPLVAAALAVIHAEPHKAWSVATLARVVGASRSVLAGRFASRLGVPPMTYLAKWRLQLAARWLRDGELPIGDIVERVGYASAAAFHRAFKRTYGVAPSLYRRRQRVAGSPEPYPDQLTA
jgi:AraC-like DNA-binding protein